MKKILEHTLITLERADDWMTKEEITNEVISVFPEADMRSVWRKLYGLAHIGRDYKLGFRYYEPDDLTNKVQECLDRGDDW